MRRVCQHSTKWEVYEQILRVPFYVVFDRYENEFRLFQLQGDRYQAVSLPQAQFWFDALPLGLGVWQGAYQGVMGRWLRWYDEAGWIPTQAERADRLAAKLRELGIDRLVLLPNDREEYTSIRSYPLRIWQPDRKSVV